MSSTFDTMQYAISWVRDKAERATLKGADLDSEQLQDILWLISDVISRLHDYSHDHDDELNRGPIAIAATELGDALQQIEMNELVICPEKSNSPQCKRCSHSRPHLFNLACTVPFCTEVRAGLAPCDFVDEKEKPGGTDKPGTT